MTLDHQKQLLHEICSEYDLKTILEVLLKLHEPQAVTSEITALTAHVTDRLEPANTTTTPANTATTGYLCPVEGWVSSGWPQ